MFKWSELTPDQKLTLMQHVEDLRKSLIISVVAIFVCTIGAFYFSKQLFAFFTHPLTALGLKLNYIDITEPFMVQLKVSLIGGIAVAFPIILWSIYRFVAPALYRKERRYVIVLVPIILLLFVGGCAFSYFGLLQLILLFFQQTGQDFAAASPMLTLDNYLSFVMAFSLPFGFVFELPVAIFFLTKIGIITPQFLTSKRKYAILIIFILSAILSPGGNPIPQLLMAFPIWILYEISVIVSKLTSPRKKKTKEIKKSEDKPIEESDPS
ncbi:MAG: twin-arginine translocase subunit TatC [Acidobacteriota bacterium]